MKFAVRRFKLGAGDWDSVLMEDREGYEKEVQTLLFVQFCSFSNTLNS